MLNPLRAIAKALDRFKDDETLMQEEVALFAQVMESDDHEQATGKYIPVPRRVIHGHLDKLDILCKRGHVVDSEGGWKY